MTAGSSSRTSPKPLKEQNRALLTALLVLNLAVVSLAVQTGDPFSLDLGQTVHHWRAFLSAGVGVALAGVVNGLLSSDAKARIVFWRWSDPLPGSFAFSHYAHRDPRIDIDQLRKKVGPFPSVPRDQNALWYKLYRAVRNEPAVIDAHRHFLLTRDFAGVALLLLFTAAPIGVWYIPSRATAGVYVALLLLQYLLSGLAARNYGVRFVKTVLALTASS